MREEIQKLEELEKLAKQGEFPEAAARQHTANKLTTREMMRN